MLDTSDISIPGDGSRQDIGCLIVIISALIVLGAVVWWLA